MNFVFNIKFANNANLPTEHDVVNNLAITPSQMAQLTAQGRAVSINSSASVMGYIPCNNLDEMPAEFIRGIDDVELWDKSQESQEKLRHFKRMIEQRSQGVTPNTQN